MIKYFQISAITLFCVLSTTFGCLAQTPGSDLFHDADGNTYHQLFLEFQVEKILEISYMGEEITNKVDSKLSSDGYSVVIKNYPGNKSVRLKVLDSNGHEREVTKSRCFIDPVLMSL